MRREGGSSSKQSSPEAQTQKMSPPPVGIPALKLFLFNPLLNRHRSLNLSLRLFPTHSPKIPPASLWSSLSPLPPPSSSTFLPPSGLRMMTPSAIQKLLYQAKGSVKLVNMYSMLYAFTKGKCFFNSTTVTISKDDLLGFEFPEMQRGSQHEDGLILDSDNNSSEVRTEFLCVLGAGVTCHQQPNSAHEMTNGRVSTSDLLEAEMNKNAILSLLEIISDATILQSK